MQNSANTTNKIYVSLRKTAFLGEAGWASRPTLGRGSPARKGVLGELGGMVRSGCPIPYNSEFVEFDPEAMDTTVCSAAESCADCIPSKIPGIRGITCVWMAPAVDYRLVGSRAIIYSALNVRFCRVWRRVCVHSAHFSFSSRLHKVVAVSHRSLKQSVRKRICLKCTKTRATGKSIGPTDKVFDRRTGLTVHTGSRERKPIA